MNSLGFDVISSNCDIMIPIYKMLNFIDQLRLSRVSISCQQIFENFIWTHNYSILEISKCPQIKLTNASRDHILHLQENEDLQEFLQVYADKVYEFTEIAELPLSLREFHNLTSLRYHHMIISEEHLQLVADNCVHLESLQLYYCRHVNDLQHMVLGKYDSVDFLTKMKNLKKLQVEAPPKLVTIKYQHFQKIIYELRKLEHLHISAAVEPDPNVRVYTGMQNHPPLKLQHLDIVININPQHWSENYSIYLRNFETIVSLNCKMSDIITEEIIIIFAKTCRNLQILKLWVTTFKDITFFALPPKVNELHLSYCDGLTYDNLRQLLTQHRCLTKFYSSNNQYEGIFQDFHISSTIQSIAVNEVEPSAFRSAYEDNTNLKEITLFAAEEDDIQKIRLNKCLNLATLDIQNGCINLATLLQLPSLHQLTICIYKSHTWSYIIGLLKHPFLRELIIGEYYAVGTKGNLERPAYIPNQGFPVNMNFLKVPMTLFANAMDFFLDLYHYNPHLKMLFYGDYQWWSFWAKDIIEKMIFHKNFPRNLKKIEICCYKIDCRDLHANFDKTMEKFQHEEDHERDDYRKDFYIKMCAEK